MGWKLASSSKSGCNFKVLNGQTWPSLDDKFRRRFHFISLNRPACGRLVLSIKIGSSFLVSSGCLSRK